MGEGKGNTGGVVFVTVQRTSSRAGLQQTLTDAERAIVNSLTKTTVQLAIKLSPDAILVENSDNLLNIKNREFLAGTLKVLLDAGCVGLIATTEPRLLTPTRAC